MDASASASRHAIPSFFPHPSRYQLLHPPHHRNPHLFVVACSLLASMNSLLLGYDIGVTSGALLFIKDDLHISEAQEEVLVSSLSFVSLGGSLFAGRLADAVGRRWTMASAAGVFLVGAMSMGMAPSFPLLMAGRVLAGFGVGIALTVAPVYTAEVAPFSIRGSLVSLPEVFINVGILFGYISNYAFSGLPANLAWRVMLALGILPALCLAVGVVFMPESPRWLVMRGKIDEARAVIVRTSSDSVESERRLSDIIEAVGFLGGDGSGNINGHHAGSGDVNGHLVRTGSIAGQHHVWRELMCPVPSVRRMLVVALGVQFFQQAIGIDATVYYSPEAFQYAGIHTKSGIIAATVVMGFVKCIFILVATVYLDKIGRRPLLLASAAGMAASLLSVSFLFFYAERKIAGSGADGNDGTGTVAILTIFFVCCYVAAFSIGMGPVVWVLITEVFPLRLRAQGVSLSITVSRLTSTVVSLTFLTLTRVITFAGTYLVFAAISVCAFAFLYAFVPETKGKTLEETVKFFCDNDGSSIVELNNQMMDGGKEGQDDDHAVEDPEPWTNHHDDGDIKLPVLAPNSDREGSNKSAPK